MPSATHVRTSRGQFRFFHAAVVLGACTLIIGLWYAPQRTWANLLLVNLYLVGLGMGGLVWLSLYNLTGARWSESLKQIPQAMSAVLPAAAIGLLAVLVCRPSLYAWSSTGFADGAASPLRHVWLTRPFFLIRAVIYLGLWLGFAAAFLRISRRREPAGAAARRHIGFSGAFLMIFGFTLWLASHDWIMSLEPEWTSTMFGVYNFAGIFLSSLAAIIVL